MEFILVHAAIPTALFASAVVAALWAVASKPPKALKKTDVFDFATYRRTAIASTAPDLRRYPARDGQKLAFRLYESSADRILIFVHGSSYHGAGYDALATFLSSRGLAKVVLPNLRGHHQSGQRRGDVDYIGQLEDDVVDLISFLRGEGLVGPITLGGHSSGGGFVIRFAGGAHPGGVSSFLILSPAVPVSSSFRDKAGGWSNLHLRRLYGLLLLNGIGIRGFNALPIIEFNKPVEFWDGTETLSYSYRLNTSYHPRYKYRKDLEALGGNAFVLVGDKDQAVDAQALLSMFAEMARPECVKILENVDHFGVFRDPAALEAIAEWIRSTPSEGADFAQI